MIGDRCLRVAHHAFILFLVVATTAVLSAQTVVDPRFVEFSPSANHNTNASDGTPLVQRYLADRLRRRVVGRVRHDGPREADAERRRHPRGFSAAVAQRADSRHRVRGASQRGRSWWFSCQLPVERIFVPAGMRTVAQLDRAVGWFRRGDRQRRRDSRSGLHLVGDFERGLDHVDGCQRRKRERIGALRCCRQHGFGSQRHPDGRRADLHRQPGGAVVRLHGVADESSDAGRGWPRLDRRHRARRLRLDGSQQQHRLADGDEWRERKRQWDGGVQHDSESQRDAAQRFNHDRRTDILGDASGCAVHLHVDAAQPIRGVDGRHRFSGRRSAEWLRLDWRQQQRMVNGDERRERQRQWQRGF